MSTQGGPKIDELIRRLDGDIVHLSVGAHRVANGERLVADVQAQIMRIDERAALESTPRLRVLTRRAAKLVLQEVLEPRHEIAQYDGMISRPPGAPTEPPFLVGVSRETGEQLVLKSYGFDREREPRMLKLVTDLGLPGFVRVFNYARVPEGTWLLMERLEGRSLTEIWGPTDRPRSPQDAIAVTRELAAHCKRLHELEIRKDDWPSMADAVSPDLSEFTDALAGRAHLYGHVRERAPKAPSASMVAWPERILSHSDVFAANVVRRDSDGTYVLVDPDPMLTPRALDAAKWIASAGSARDLGPMVLAWTGVEPLEAAELAMCLSVQLWKQAAIHEISKRIRDPDAVEKYGVPRTFVDDEILDDATDAMLKASVALKDELASRKLRDIEDVVNVLSRVSEGVDSTIRQRTVL